MRGSGRGVESKPKAFIMDTAALLARLQLHMYYGDLYTTPSVLAEVKDFESLYGLELSAAASRLTVKEPEPGYRALAEEVARRRGVLSSLSKADIEVLALALELREKGVSLLVLTDDYVLQRLLASEGIDFAPVKTVGIRERGRREGLGAGGLSTS